MPKKGKSINVRVPDELKELIEKTVIKLNEGNKISDISFSDVLRGALWIGVKELKEHPEMGRELKNIDDLKRSLARKRWDAKLKRGERMNNRALFLLANLKEMKVIEAVNLVPITKANAYKLFRRLRDEGLVKIEEKPVMRVYLTEKGITYVKSMKLDLYSLGDLAWTLGVIVEPGAESARVDLSTMVNYQTLKHTGLSETYPLSAVLTGYCELVGYTETKDGMCHIREKGIGFIDELRKGEVLVEKIFRLMQ